MIYFYILLFIPIFLQYIAIKGRIANIQKSNLTALVCFFVLLTVLVAFRHETVGNDTQNYINIFESFSHSSWNSLSGSNLEIGFSVFNKFLSTIKVSSRGFVMISAILTIAMIFPTYKRLCLDATLSIVVFSTLSTFIMMFSGIRQMLAVGIGFIAYEFTRTKKPIYFLLSVAVAFTFHTSAFILLVMYPLYHARITKSWVYVIVPSLAITFVFNKEIFGVLSRFMDRFTEYDTTMASTGAYTMIVLFALFSLFAFVIPDESMLDQETIGLRNFLLLSLAIQLFAPLHSLAMRMNYYFIIFIPLLLPKIVNARRSEWNRVAIWGRNLMVALFTLYFFYSAYSGYGEGNLHVFPYHFFWENL